MNILTWTILKKTQMLNGCETFAFKYISISCHCMKGRGVNSTCPFSFVSKMLCRASKSFDNLCSTFIIYIICRIDLFTADTFQSKKEGNDKE